MRLISCYIVNFGLHHEKEISFTPGMNSFAWDNGAGKTTLSVFIKAMLYGLNDNRKGKEENERKKYSPWQGGTYGGSITFEAGGRKFIAKRTFGKTISDDTFALFDEKTGGVSNFYSENLGEELFGIDCDGFMRTVFWSEKSIPRDSRVNASVASRLSDIMGADGDVGSFDKAISSLDKHRQIYQKRGGGEIAELKARISSLKGEIEELELLAKDGEAVRSELDTIKSEIKALSEERDRLSDRLVEIEKIKTKRRDRETYLGYVGDVKDEQAVIDEIDKFFGGIIPSEDELRKIRAAEVEANSISRELSVSTEANGEIDTLAQMFASGVNQVDIENAESTVKEIRECNDRLRELQCGNDEYSEQMRNLFPAKVPTFEEIDERISRLEEKAKRGISALAVVGILLAIAGVGCGFIHPALFGICAVGVVLFAIGMIRGGRDNEGVIAARELLCEIEPGFDGDVIGGLYEKKRSLERYEKLSSLREEKMRELNDRIDTGRRFIDNFFKRVGVDGTYPEYAIKDVKDKHLKYSALLLSHEQGASERFKRRQKENELRVMISEFCAKYPTKTADPISEIEGKVRERAYRVGRLKEKIDICERFKLDYGISDVEEPFDDGEEQRIRSRMFEIDSEIAQKRRIESSTAATYSGIVAKLDTEEDIRAKIASSEDRLFTCERNLRIIKKAMELLEIAHENMTLRYTGATQKRFSHYMSIINGEAGEYRLDTDFGITKTDGGVPRGEDQYSRGTKELYSLAMRLALTDSLYEGELPFLVLDDPFIAYDDGRGRRARDLLSAIARERQILYFTCSTARNI